MFRNALALFLAAAALATGADWVWRGWQLARPRDWAHVCEGHSKQPPDGIGSPFRPCPAWRDVWFGSREAEAGVQLEGMALFRVPHWLILALAAPFPVIFLVWAGVRSRGNRRVSRPLHRAFGRTALRWTLAIGLAACALRSGVILGVGAGGYPPIPCSAPQPARSWYPYPSWQDFVAEDWMSRWRFHCGCVSEICSVPQPFSFSPRERDVCIVLPLGSASAKSTPPWPNPQIARWGAEYSWHRTESGGRLHVFTIPYWLILVATAPYPLYLVVADPLRRRRRRRRGLCPMCGYDLRGSPSGVCSECGWGGAMSPDSR